MLDQSNSSLTVFSDGGARGNPGPAASAFVIYENDKLIKQDSKYLGETTNNVAEYNGVILALQSIANNSQIKFCMDSELVVKQLNGLYKIKDKKLIELAQEVKMMIKSNNLKVNFVHVLREKNKIADALVNEKLDNSSRL